MCPPINLDIYLQLDCSTSQCRCSHEHEALLEALHPLLRSALAFAVACETEMSNLLATFLTPAALLQASTHAFTNLILLIVDTI